MISRSGPSILGGSWVVITRVITRVTILITHIRGLITPLITTHEPSSSYTVTSPTPRRFSQSSG